MKTPTTLIEAVAYFSDPDRAFEYAVKLRWPNGVACPRMGRGSAAVQFIKTRKIWRCKECKRQFTVKVGTIFEDSPIPFTKWLPAIWLLANTKNGTSSHELGRARRDAKDGVVHVPPYPRVHENGRRCGVLRRSRSR